MKKRHLLVVLFALLGWTQARADVEINETNFPDENFRSYLLGRYYGSDEVITDEEIAGITYFAITDRNISSLKGIEFFTALTYLNCDRNQLTSLDVSGCKALTSLSCIKNQLTTLNVSGCTALTNLSCYINKLTTLDVSGCTALKVLRCFSNQIRGTAMSALIKSLPRTVNENELYVIYSENEGNVMTTTQAAVAKAKGRTPLYFDSTQNKWLEYAGSAPSGDAAAGVEINETNFPDENFRKYLLLEDGSDGVFTDEEIARITSIIVPGSSIASLKGIKFFTALTYLNCINNQLTSLDVSKNTALTKLRCRNNQLTSLDVSKNTALTELDCDNNQLTALDVSKHTALVYLICATNQLTSLNVQSTALLGLDCSNNKLTSLIVSNSIPDNLDCSSNQIKGAAMDAFIASLSQSNYGVLKIINSENEGNEMTKAQVDAAKAKGWTPSYRSGSVWMEYAGCDAAAGVEINETNFPDENFRSFLLSEDYGSDGVFTDEEIAGITNLAIIGRNISNLKGIEFFTALTKLNCDKNQFTSLDVSGCTALTSLSCNKNQLTALDVSKNTALTSLSCSSNQLTSLDVSKNTALTKLNCYRNQLTTLNVSGCTALTNLSCQNNQLTTLDVSGCYALKVLSCYSNQIRGTAMSALIESLPRTVNENELYVIYSENEGNVMTTTQAAVAKAKGRTPLYFDSTQSKWLEYAGSAPSGDAAAGVEINETNFPDENFRKYLLLMDGSDGVFTDEEIARITSITVPGSSIASLKGIEFFTALEYLYCTNNQLTALDVSKNTALKHLRCANNQLTALDVSKNTALISLQCYDNQLTALDVSKNTALTSLQCYDNQLTSLDITKNTALARLYCSNNQLTSLNVQSTALLGLDCSNNKLTSLIVSNSLPDDLDCSSNQIKDAAMDAFIASLSQSNYGVLKIINSENEGNEMTKAQVDAAKAKGWTPSYRSGSVWMEYAGCDAAAGVEINETNFPDENFRNYLLRQSYGSDGVLTDEEIAEITILAIRNGNIASLKGIEFFTALETLDCRGNQLTSLNVSKNTALTTLYCNANQLTALDVSGCTALNNLACFYNKLTALDVSKNTALTSLYCYHNQIKGAAMDALIKSLPATTGELYIIMWSYDEENVMTKAQVAAAKAKGWTPFGVGVSLQGQVVVEEYIGSDPAAIEPIAEETTVSFGGTSGVDESTDLSNTAVNDVLYTLDNTTGNGYDNTDQSITITSVVSDANIAEAEALTPGSPEFAEKFNGITIELAAGTGSVTFDCQTIGNRVLTVKIGNAPAATYSKSERGEVKVDYNVAAPTFMYVYATAVAGARGSEPTTIENALKLYGFTVKPGDTTGISAINSDKPIDGSDVYFDLSGRRVMTPQKGVYVKNGKKVVVK